MHITGCCLIWIFYSPSYTTHVSHSLSKTGKFNLYFGTYDYHCDITTCLSICGILRGVYFVFWTFGIWKMLWFFRLCVSGAYPTCRIWILICYIHANDQSLSQTLYEAYTTLHGDSGEPNDLSRMFILLSNLDKTVRTRFYNVEARFNNLQETLKTITTDVNHLKGAVNIVEEDLRDMKVNVIPALEKKTDCQDWGAWTGKASNHLLLDNANMKQLSQK